MGERSAGRQRVLLAKGVARMAGRPRLVELLLALGVAALGLGEVLVPFPSRQLAGSEIGSAVGVALVATTLLWCRRVPLFPMLAFPVIWGVVAAVAPPYILFYGQMVPLLVCVFMAARYGTGRAVLYTALTAAGSLLALDVTVPSMRALEEVFFHWTVTILVWSAGSGLSAMERRAHESTRRAIAAEVNAAEQTMRAVVEERTLIARELHDIVGHAVSSMVVQAGAAEQAGPGDEEFVGRALSSIRTTGNDALDEMRRLVSMLRTAEDAPLAPQPRLSSLPTLVAGCGGPDVRLEVTGEVRSLPTGLDLAIYRIIQEALTNVRRHSGASYCSVSLAYEPDAVRVEVVDDGRGGGTSSAPGGSPGHGLIGMRERCSLYGGRFVAGPEPGGGFAVRASLPVAR